MLRKLLSWTPFLVSFFTSVGLTAVLIRVCTWKHWLVFPREERWSQRALAKFGGVAIILSLLAGASTLPLGHHWRVIVLLTTAMAILGLLDDIFDLQARWKLAGQVGIAILAVWNGIGYPLFQHFWPNFLFVVFFLVAITNAFNLLDNMDGLAAGVGIIAAVSLWLMGPGPGTFSKLLLVMIGSLLGFLLFNFNPATILMGDMGSLAIGFFLACSTIVTADHITTVFSVLSVPGLVLFLPLFDMLLVSITRRLNGRAISAGARDHTSHRLVMLGMSERRAVLTLYCISALSGTLALACKNLSLELGAGILAIFLLSATLLWFYLANAQLPNECLSRTNVFTLALPETLNSLARRSAMVFTDIALLVISQYAGFLVRFDHIPPNYLSSFLWGCALAIVVKLPLFSLFGIYRGDSRIRTLRDIYPIAKGNVLGSLIIVTALTYIAGFHNFSRAVMGVDVVLATCLMVTVRAAGRFFDDVLTTFPTQSYVVVGEASAEFYYRYFEWQKLHSNIIAFVSSAKADVRVLYRIPVISTSELPALLGKKRVHAMYLLPDCPRNTTDFTIHLARQHGIPVHTFRLKVEILDTVPALPDAVYAGAGNSPVAQ